MSKSQIIGNGGAGSVMRSSFPAINPNVDNSRSVRQAGPQGVITVPGYDNDSLTTLPANEMTLTDTIGGSPVAGDHISITIGGKYTIPIIVVAGATSTTAVAAQLAAAINASSAAIFARATSAAAVVTIAITGGLVAVGTDLTKVDFGGMTQTLSGVAFASGVGPFIPRQTFVLTTVSGPAKTPFTFTFREGKAYDLSAPLARMIFGS